MARAQGGNVAKFVWPLVIFGAGFVICLLLAIIFYTQLTDARVRADEAQQQLNEFITEGQRNGPAVQQFRDNQEADSVFGAMLSDIESLKGIIGVSNNTGLEQIRSQMSEAGGEGSLLETVRQLNSELQSTNNQLETTRQQLQQAQSQVQQLQQQKQKMAGQFDQTRQQLQSQYENQRQRASQLQSELDELQQQLTEQMNQTRQQLQQQVSDLESQNEELTQENEQLQAKVDDLLARPGPEDVASHVARPDGRVMSVLEGPASGQQRAYINLGRQHSLRLGTTFEVYEAGSLVELSAIEGAEPNQAQGQRQMVRMGPPADQQQQNRDEAMRGKATVQVYEVNDDSALVRVVRSDEDQPLEDGDVLVNLIYDPEQTLVFHVYGQFDLDGDGNATSQEAERLKSIIREWGGKVADELSYQVDFLVLGQQPELPEESPQNMTDPEQIEQEVAKRKKYRQYQELVTQARQLAIPAMNKTRFMTLVGQYDR
jgi:DNA polymerase III alpha subunit (gram-positive type)